MTKTFHHLSHIDLDGYSCQLVMAQTPHTMISYNANYGAEVMDRLEEIIESLKKKQAGSNDPDHRPQPLSRRGQMA